MTTKEKLHVPGSADREDFSELNITIVLSWALSMLICIGLFLALRGQLPTPDPGGEGSTSVAGESAEEMSPLEQSVEQFRVGPREKSELACAELKPQIASGELAGPIDQQLQKVLNQRLHYAPWTCVLEAYLSGEISAELAIHAEIAEFWQQAQAFNTPTEILGPALQSFRQREALPENPDFMSWLRLCAMSPRATTRVQCLELLASVSPAQGEDALMMVEEHLQRRRQELSAEEMAIVVDGLGSLANSGQPLGWRVQLDPEDPAFSSDSIRIGAAFMLCRALNSPDQGVAAGAANALAKAATMSARDANMTALRRWREACHYAFVDAAAMEEQDCENANFKAPQIYEEVSEATAERPEEAPADERAARDPEASDLAVWDGREDSRPDYSLKAAIERGLCAADPSAAHPAWTCALERWRGPKDDPFDLTLQRFFIKTSYVEWCDF